MHPATLPIDQLRRECQTERLRRSGPGGQHRNKVETAVVITHMPTEVAAEANERRSQSQNLEVAVQRLRVQLALQIRCENSMGEAPSARWQTRIQRGRIAVNKGHEDYPALLAEALDALAQLNWDDRAAAQHLGLSRTQLIRFLQIEPKALERLNEARQALGLPRLR